MARCTITDGLYAITDSTLIPPGQLLTCVAQAIAGGATVVQYRNKQAPDHERHREAAALATLCNRHTIPLLVNDDADLAAAVGASGVHLGQFGGDSRDFRRLDAVALAAHEGLAGKFEEHAADGCHESPLFSPAKS